MIPWEARAFGLGWNPAPRESLPHVPIQEETGADAGRPRFPRGRSPHHRRSHAAAPRGWDGRIAVRFRVRREGRDTIPESPVSVDRLTLIALFSRRCRNRRGHRHRAIVGIFKPTLAPQARPGSHRLSLRAVVRPRPARVPAPARSRRRRDPGRPSCSTGHRGRRGRGPRSRPLACLASSAVTTDPPWAGPPTSPSPRSPG